VVQPVGLALVAVAVLFGCAPAKSPPFAAGCGGAQSHALDFWIGDWDVYEVDGRPSGHNVVRKTLAGCAVEERWRDVEGHEGHGLFYVDRARGRWKQVWLTDAGEWKEKEQVDGAPDGSVRFEGTVPVPRGGVVRDRTTLTPVGGEVLQVIEQQRESEATPQRWTGRYVRRATPVRSPE
jgi:hypothetical protein